MNKSRRKKIEAIKNLLSTIQTDLEEIRDEEQEAYDNLPESMQDGEKGEKMYEAIDNLETACSSLEEIQENLDEAMQ